LGFLEDIAYRQTKDRLAPGEGTLTCEAAFLHQLVVSAHLTMTLRAAGGVRVVCEFLD
jgi:hypothetical protein